MRSQKYLRQIYLASECGEELLRPFVTAMREAGIEVLAKKEEIAERLRLAGGVLPEGVMVVSDGSLGRYYEGRPDRGMLYYRRTGTGEDVWEKYVFEGADIPDPEELTPEYLERVYRRQRALPWDVIETERCLLRETCEADLDRFYEIYAEPSVTDYMEALFPDRAMEEAYTKSYRETVYEFYGFGVWTVVLKETGEIIGRAGISMREGCEDPELGFLIGVPWQRKGLAYEVCRACLRFAREEAGFDRVVALVQPENDASRRLCRKLGMNELGEIAENGVKYIKYFVTV